MTTLRKGGFVREMQRVKAEQRKKPYEDYIMHELEAINRENGYSAWCKDGISGEYGVGLRRSGYALTKTNAEIDAEINQMLQNLHIEGVEIADET
jgi:hypothetical protein